MGLINFLAGVSKEMERKEQDEKKRNLEREMNAYNLDEEEKKLVRKGEYNPWDFETDNREEDDDYYSEDSDK